MQFRCQSPVPDNVERQTKDPTLVQRTLGQRKNTPREIYALVGDVEIGRAVGSGSNARGALSSVECLNPG